MVARENTTIAPDIEAVTVGRERVFPVKRELTAPATTEVIGKYYGIIKKRQQGSMHLHRRGDKGSLSCRNTFEPPFTQRIRIIAQAVN